MNADHRVNFIIAGTQKGGTTALHAYLRDEPGVSMSATKELHFFDDETQDWARPDYGAYHAAFEPADGRLRGEATPIYLYWPNSLERMAAYNPALKIILMLRDPVQRAWSHWKMEYARGAEREPFAWCIREGRRRLLDVEPWGFHREFSYVERGFYGEQLERLYGLLPREQVLILRDTDLLDSPATAMAQVREFLGLKAGGAAVARRVHEGREMDYGSELTAQDVTWLRQVYARDAERLNALCGIGFS